MYFSGRKLLFSHHAIKIFISTALAAGVLSSCGFVEKHTSRETYNALTFSDGGKEYAEKATIAYSQGKFADAVWDVEKSLKQNPRNLQALMVGALVSEKLGRINNAKKYYEDVILYAGDETTVLGTNDMLPQPMKEVAAKRLRLLNLNQSKFIIEDSAGMKVFNISDAAADRQGKSALEEALFIREQKNTRQNQAEREANVKAVEVLFTPEEQNIISRFLILKELAENDMITKEEFLNARQSNIGGLLPLTHTPPAYGAEKAVPSPDVIIERINALKSAVEDRAITPREFSAERNLIVEAILPPAPRQRLKPKAPARDILSAAKDIRKLEVIYDLNLITSKEKEKEQLTIERSLGLNTKTAAKSKVPAQTQTTMSETIELVPAQSLEAQASTPVSVAPAMPAIAPVAPSAAPQPLLPNVTSPFAN